MRTRHFLAGAAVAIAVAGDALANGTVVQREVTGQVVAVDAVHGTIVVEREVRGQRYRLTLTTRPDTPTFQCTADRGSIDVLRAGDAVSVYYEPMGRGALANLVIVETR